MGEVYLTSSFGHGTRIATYENGEITNGSSSWSNQKVIAKYYGDTVTEAYLNSSQTLGHVSGKFGYLGSPYFTSTGTPFIYADTCNRIFLYSTDEHVAEFEGDMTGALLAYIAYYCNGNASNISNAGENHSSSYSSSSSGFHSTGGGYYSYNGNTDSDGSGLIGCGIILAIYSIIVAIISYNTGENFFQIFFGIPLFIAVVIFFAKIFG